MHGCWAYWNFSFYIHSPLLHSSAWINRIDIYIYLFMIIINLSLPCVFIMIDMKENWCHSVHKNCFTMKDLTVLLFLWSSLTYNSEINVTFVILRFIATPQVSLESVQLKEDQMTVTWSFIRQSTRRKRSTSPPSVSVVVYYQPDGGEEAHYPPEGSVAAEEREVIIKGKFDVKATYKVWLKVYEGGLAVSSLQTKAVGAAVETGTVDNYILTSDFSV